MRRKAGSEKVPGICQHTSAYVSIRQHASAYVMQQENGGDAADKGKV
jgi:hypothetical protein